MKRTLMVQGILALGIVTFTLGSAAMAGPGRHARHGHRMRQQIIQRFDKDGDGQLNDAERAAARAAHEARRTERVARFTAKFDANHDGVLSPEERTEARQTIRANMQNRRAEIKARFDTDHDGVLSPAERAAARQALRNRIGALRNAN